MTQTNWEELLVLAGFKIKVSNRSGKIQFNEEQLNHENLSFLIELLKAVGVKSHLSKLYKEEVPSRESWVQALYKVGGKYTEMLYPANRLLLREIDIAILALVQELNERGLETIGSCSGHNRRPAQFYFKTTEIANIAYKFFRIMQLEASRTGREVFLRMSELDLMSLGLELFYQRKQIKENLMMNAMKKREALLETLLSIPGASGKEENVRTYIMDYLKGKVDSMEVDKYGNLLVIKQWGEDDTILLSSHMDVVPQDIDLNCLLLKEERVWSRPGSILGADDRAGIAIILSLLDTITHRDFRGTLKVAFTVEEEIGLCGARNIDETFFGDVVGAISFDRRGKRDIVVGNGLEKYCSVEYGKIFEEVSRSLFGCEDAYQLVQGGLSDLAIWSRLGINSVNLSVGFNYEHTENEILDLETWHRTFELTKIALQRMKYYLNKVA